MYELGRNTILPVTVVKFNIRDNREIDNIWLNFITRRIQYHLQSILARRANLYKQLSGTLQRVSVMKDEERPRKFFKWKELFHIKETKTTGQLEAVYEPEFLKRKLLGPLAKFEYRLSFRYNMASVLQQCQTSWILSLCYDCARKCPASRK